MDCLASFSFSFLSASAENSNNSCTNEALEACKKTNQNEVEPKDTVDHVAVENGKSNVTPIIQNGDKDHEKSTENLEKSVDCDSVKSNGEACEENSDVACESSNVKVDTSNADESSVNEENKTSTSTTKSDESTNKTNEIFTDAMIDRIEQNYNPSDEDGVNLLETPDEEIFGLEAKPEENDTLESNKVSENLDASEAVNLLIQGKRNMLLKDYESAVSTLGDACRKFASTYGDLGVECAEVYMTYGQALLELWRVEDANKKKIDDIDDSKVAENNDDLMEDDSEIQENSTAETDGEESLLEKDQNEKTDVEDTNESVKTGENCVDENAEAPESDDKIETADKMETADSVPEDEANKEEENQAENNDDEEVESEDEVDNLEVAWEILELAKRIYEKTNDDANLAKVHSKLGEISIASGNFVYAIDDLKRSLELIAKTPSVDIRHKANIHFQLYIAHSMKCSFPEAEAELRIAKSTFETHLRDLEKKMQSVAKEKTTEVDAISSEIKEIKEVIQDMNSKMVESHKEKRELISAISEVIKNKHQQSDTPSSSADMPSSSAALPTSNKSLSNFSPLKSDVPVNNISHLIRKKPKEPKNEEKTAEKLSNELPPNTEAVLNGENSSESNGAVNESENVPELSAKRKATDDMENEAKKFCA